MARGKSPTARQWVTLSSATVAYLAKLAKLGTHGSSVPDVAKTLIEAGVRDAIERDYIAKPRAAGRKRPRR